MRRASRAYNSGRVRSSHHAAARYSPAHAAALIAPTAAAASAPAFRTRVRNPGSAFTARRKVV